jgi:kynurenine formamidase
MESQLTKSPLVPSLEMLLELTYNKPSELIDDEDLEAAEESAGVALREDDLVVLRTGWETYSSNLERYKEGFPTLSGNAVDYLPFRRIAGVGVDCPNVDSDPQLSTHKALFRAGVC